jgi:hypothetical protein
LPVAWLAAEAAPEGNGKLAADTGKAEARICVSVNGPETTMAAWLDAIVTDIDPAAAFWPMLDGRSASKDVRP